MNVKNLKQYFTKNVILLSIIISVLIALLVTAITDDNIVWSWAVPLGIGVGAAINAGISSKS